MRPTSRPDILAAVLAVAALTAIAAAARAGGEESAPNPSVPGAMTATATMTATVRLAADRSAFAAGEPVILHVTLANPGTRRVAILRWRTPLDGVTAPLFTVTRDGVDVPYVGRTAKRPPPTDGDYVTLEPGASVTSDVDLAQLHALATPGHYVVTYDVESPQLFLPKKNAPPIDGRLTSPPLRIAIEAPAR